MNVGKNIARLRKEKGITQEQLAQAVMVSGQAVSKWENGGSPDVELLPAIADQLGVSLDVLFGRDAMDYTGLHQAMRRKLVETPEEERFQAAFEMCWTIERALFGGKLSSEIDLQDFLKDLSPTKKHASRACMDKGCTLMELKYPKPYFLLVPEGENGAEKLLSGVDYRAFFEDMARPHVLDALIFLHKRESQKSFTVKYLAGQLGISEQETQEVFACLIKYGLLHEQKLEMEDEVISIYSARPDFPFVALLMMAHELIQPANCFSYYNRNRSKPFLNDK